MGFRFSKKIAPGVRVSMSRQGPSISGRIGPKGLGVSLNSRGQMTASAGAGGLRYQRTRSIRPGRGPAATSPAGSTGPPAAHTVSGAHYDFVVSIVRSTGLEDVAEAYRRDPTGTVEAFVDQYMDFWLEHDEGDGRYPDVVDATFILKDILKRLGSGDLA